jgi:pimeloyl-ACP methyl ester carboxylesterase
MTGALLVPPSPPLLRRSFCIRSGLPSTSGPITACDAKRLTRRIHNRHIIQADFLPDCSRKLEAMARIKSSATLQLRPAVMRVGHRWLRVDRGVLVVPARRTGASAGSIELPVVRIPGDRRGSEPVFRLGGGPGMSNLRFLPPAALADHDVLLVGYRGVDGNLVLDCPEVTRALRGVGRDLLSPASRSNLARAAASGAQRLERDGVDLAGFTISEVLADLEDARAALGYERISLLSESYGTRVALLYAQHHPERVHRSVMLGVNPPGHFVWDPGTVEAQLGDFAQLTHSRRGGPANRRELLATIADVLAGLPRRWRGTWVDPGKVKVLTFVLLFQRRTARLVIDAYQRAAAGDLAGLALLSLSSDLVLPRLFVWGDFIAKAMSADFEPDRDYAADLDPPSAVLGSPLSLLFFGGGEGWPVSLIPDEDRRVAPSTVQTLLIGGSLDVSTPADVATRELLPHLTRGRQVIAPETGHVDDLWRLHRQTLNQLLQRYFDEGVADVRLNAPPPDTNVRVGLPEIAHGLEGLTALALCASIAALARRERRRP